MTAMSAFVPGVTLSRRLYEHHVRPLLAKHLPDVPYSAALLGRGSEVLGYDDETSTDHDWGARILLFLAEDSPRSAADVDQVLRERLPSSLDGHLVRHEVDTVGGYLRRQLGLDLDVGVTAADWLTMPEHGLLMFTAGEVFHDEVGLHAARERLVYYPRDVWLYLMITGWWRVHPEMNLVGRAGSVGDELGSAVIGAHLVEDLMRLAFLLERQYAPYSKWFGTAFAHLACGPDLAPVLTQVLQATTWREREDALVQAHQALVRVHNGLGLTDPVGTEVVQMWDRPFKVSWADIPDRLHPLIEDPEVVRIAHMWPVGPADRLRELVAAPRHRPALARVLEPDASGDA